jgi:hypothetical protein
MAVLATELGQQHFLTPDNLKIDSVLSIANAIRSGRAVQGTKCVHSLKYFDNWFESNSGHGCLYSCFLFPCARSGFATG